MRVALVGEKDGGARRAVLDRTGTLPGRGAYLCRGTVPGEPAAACVAVARRRGSIARALRCPTPDLPMLFDFKLIESVSR
jgi:predicted RNA-binding protein YlxR (DUF448 family)